MNPNSRQADMLSAAPIGAKATAPSMTEDPLIGLARSIQEDPNDAVAWCHLGIALARAGRQADGEACLRHALSLRPDDAGLLNNLGTMLTLRQATDEAAECYLKSLALRPRHADTCRNYASLLFSQGRIDDAVAHYRQALTLSPNHPITHSDMLFALSRSADIDASSLYAEHRNYAAHHEIPLHSYRHKHELPDDPTRVIRIGFVSGDFRNHSVAYFFEPILRLLAQDPRFYLVAYSNSRIADAVTTRMKREFSVWRPTTDIGDNEMAELIHRDGIDILVDLSGHTAGNRLPVFARKPAPLQASWLGYPGTTGLDAMDYYICDRRMLPSGLLDSQFSESIVRLAWGVPFQWPEDTPPTIPLPALDCGHVCFGSFNNPDKLNAKTLGAWADLLHAIPGSRLMICGVESGSLLATLAEACSREGIPPGRTVFRERTPFAEYLRLHHEVDLCLDAFPYNGGTTTLHALRMGVPTLTITGNTMPARIGTGLLESVGLGEFVSTDCRQFVERGVEWAGRLPELAEIRRTLPQRLAESGIGRPELVAACMVNAFVTMWWRWCSGQRPAPFDSGVDEDQARSISRET